MNTAGKQAKEFGLYAEDELKPSQILGNQKFTRGNMSYVSYSALFFINERTDDRLIGRLRK